MYLNSMKYMYIAKQVCCLLLVPVLLDLSPVTQRFHWSVLENFRYPLSPRSSFSFVILLRSCHVLRSSSLLIPSIFPLPFFSYYLKSNDIPFLLPNRRFYSIPLTAEKLVPFYDGSDDGCGFNTFQWNSIIKSHISSGLYEVALSLFTSMRESSSRPDNFTLPLIIRACSALSDYIGLGKSVHCLGIKMGFENNVFFCNTLIDAYVKYKCVESAHHTFDEMPERDVVSWTSIISGYVQIGNIPKSFRLFHEMRVAGCEPSLVTLAVVLKACGIQKDENGGLQLQCFAIKMGYESCDLVQNSIMTVLTKVGSFDEAKKLFKCIDKKSVASWNVLMSGYYSRGDLSKVVVCYEKMRTNLIPSHETLTLALSVYAKCGHLLQGQKMHGFIVKTGLIDMILEATLVDFYAKCGELASSILLFEEVRAKESIPWSVMLWGFTQNGQFIEAISLFQQMQGLGHELTVDTLRGLVLAYTHLGTLRLGKEVHGYMIRNYFSNNLDYETLETSIINMYAKCGSIVLAQRCFDQMLHKDVVAWSCIIEGYATHGLGFKALDLFLRMQEEGVRPNSVTFLSLLSACSHAGLVKDGLELFDSMTTNFEITPEIDHYTCMVDLLGRCGKLYEALEIISNMNIKPDARIWGAFLASCHVHSDANLGNYAAQRLFNLEPNNVGYHVVLSNIKASENKWDEAEKIRKVMSEREFNKKPGWSCIEEKEGFYMFVSGDRAHPQVGEIYGILQCLSLVIEDRGTEATFLLT